MKKRFWSRHPWLRRCIYAGGTLLFAAIIVLLYIAYVYMPPQDRTDTPVYLRWMEQQHFDGYVNAGNFRLHYLHEGDGEPVVLLPGGGGWIYDMRDMIAALAPHYSVYAIDPPGDGYTTPIVQNPDYNRIYTLDSIDQSLLAFMDTLHIKKAAFIGNSWGERLIPQMKTPTLVIWGKQDNLLLPNLYLPRWHQLGPHAQIVMIDHAGHTVHDDQPEQVSQLILNFLAA